MTTQTLTGATGHTADPELRARIRDVAIEQFGGHGFDTKLQAIAAAAGVSPQSVTDHFGSEAGLLKACDEYPGPACPSASNPLSEKGRSGSSWPSGWPGPVAAWTS